MYGVLYEDDSKTDKKITNTTLITRCESCRLVMMSKLKMTTINKYSSLTEKEKKNLNDRLGKKVIIQNKFNEIVEMW